MKRGKYSIAVSMLLLVCSAAGQTGVSTQPEKAVPARSEQGRPHSASSTPQVKTTNDAASSQTAADRNRLKQNKVSADQQNNATHKGASANDGDDSAPSPSQDQHRVASQGKEQGSKQAGGSKAQTHLREAIERALKNEPSLRNAGVDVKVTVSENKIVATGSVATPKQRQTVDRIVRSFAGDNKVEIDVSLAGARPAPREP